MVQFVGVRSDLPRSWPRGFAEYSSPSSVEELPVTHADGYGDVEEAMGSSATISDVIDSARSVTGSTYPLGIYIGNWLIAFRGEGHWDHIIDGRPEVRLRGAGSVDVVAMASKLQEGDARGFVAVATAGASPE